MEYTYSNGQLTQAVAGSTTYAYTYDSDGNPISYYNGTRWTFTWGNSRRLETASNGTVSASYNYTADGVRTSKTVDGVTHTYYYVDGKLLREVFGTTVLDFFYDGNGTPIAMRQGSTTGSNYTNYYYITNLQGDVIRLVDIYGNTAALASIWGFPYGEEIVGTISAVDVFMGALLQVSASNYNKTSKE